MRHGLARRAAWPEGFDQGVCRDYGIGAESQEREDFALLAGTKGYRRAIDAEIQRPQSPNPKCTHPKHLRRKPAGRTMLPRNRDTQVRPR
ncbi:hypothetical protein NCCP2145_22020 [Pseudarthrobacter sp. NCCP-2145]|nr:hypothetical protein NCCP2145_22020 [Pseudarthrobacter sp. NCCP-2145]